MRVCADIVWATRGAAFKHTQPQEQMNTVSPEVRKRPAQLTNSNSFRSHSARRVCVARAAA